jgi:fructose-1,6-bisphosphatase/inositol monophosphatase family enzyme
MNFSNDLQLATQLASEAGKLVREQYGKVERLTKTHAATTDEAVTEADRAAQRVIVAGLRKHFPTDGIIGEESDLGDSITAEIRDPAGRNWVIDPIDGTNNFISGLGCFAVCIGLLDRGEPVVGVVYDVARDEMYSAGRGLGAKRNDKPLRALVTELGSASLIMMTSNLLDKKGKCPDWACRWIAQTDWKIRIHGAVTINGKLWDCVAPAAIVIEAGGIVTDTSGAPIFPFNLKNYAGAKVPFIAAGANAHRELVKEMAR